MVLLYMVLHGSHQYTPYMLACIPAPWILWDVQWTISVDKDSWSHSYNYGPTVSNGSITPATKAVYHLTYKLETSYNMLRATTVGRTVVPRNVSSSHGAGFFKLLCLGSSTLEDLLWGISSWVSGLTSIMKHPQSTKVDRFRWVSKPWGYACLSVIMKQLSGGMRLELFLCGVWHGLYIHPIFGFVSKHAFFTKKTIGHNFDGIFDFKQNPWTLFSNIKWDIA